ncbi:hypothetical protein Y032_0655g1200 [Ancylostoma ceylanicum]|nr:hypothetical protein Y032_0655g1200 [Ancylostoma ceylanicum]
MVLLAYSVRLVVLVVASVNGLKVECFSCRSNADWSYYMQRIPGLKMLNASEYLPLAPLACTFDPLRIYADRSSAACNGYCMKWASAKILDDGGLEVNFLRGCVDSIMQTNYTPPAEDRCYQSPDHFTHQAGVEYRSTCFCKGFMCNESKHKHIVIVFIMVFFSNVRY